MAALIKFRQRIALLVALAAIALIAVTAVSLVLGRRNERQVASIETRYVPILELNRDLGALATAIQRSLEDAASAGERDKLVEADALRDRFRARLDAGQQVIVDNGGDPRQLLADFEAYYALGRDVAAALIAEDTSETLAGRIEAMRTAQQSFAARLDASTTPDRARIAAAFATARRAHRTAFAIDVIVAVVALVLILVLSWTIVRRATRSLRALSLGMERLARGDFSEEIHVATQDEFGDVARQGNLAARQLREYRDQGEREDWIKTGTVGLRTEIAGEVDPLTVGRKALAYLARTLGAQVAVVYTGDAGGTFRLLDTHGTAASPGPPETFRVGETQLGQAARDDEIRVLADVPADYLRIRSALGDMAARQVVIVPLAHEGRVMGVLELAFSRDLSEAGLELLRRIRIALGVAFRVAEAQERTQSLLEETQRQAEELREAYDTLESRNQTLQSSEEQLQAQQEELRQTNDELAAQTAALEAQRSAVQNKNEALVVAQRQLEEKAAELARTSRYKSEFLANMSHELRTPLNSIMILSRILAENEEGNLGAKQVEFATIIHKSGEELLTLINDVLDLSKVEAGKQDVVTEPLATGELGAYVERMFLAVAEQKGLALEVVVDDDAPREVVTDRAKLYQILKNLISNAIKFTERGRVGVHVSAVAGGRVGIEVSDTGIGIPPEKQQTIFEAFAQADGSTSRKYGGTGLGLSIARQLAALLGGELTVDSIPGTGSTFRVVLPIAGPAAVERAPVAGSPPRPARQSSPPATAPITVADDRATISPGDPCLLVIEDDAAFASIVLRMIRDAGLPGLVAPTGREGLALVQRHRPSGIILDVGLPDMDGWTVMEHLQAAPASRDIPVHVVTAGDDATRAKQLGAVGFLAKPVDAAQLRSALDRLDATAPLRTVLLVAADPSVRASIAALLAGNGLEVEAEADHDRALERLHRRAVGGVVVNLAEGDKERAFALLAALRADDRTAALPVIVHTGLALSSGEIRRLERDHRATVVVEGEHSHERVLDETRLFLHRVRARLPAPPEAEPGRDGAVLDGKTVLIVDDDMRNVYSLSSALRARHLQVRTAADGQEALDELERHPDTSAVLMDIMMPHMDGHEATRRIREQARFEKLPIIALTAKTMPGERKKCLDAGANDYVPKPVDVDRLLALLRVWLS